jgi:hypothetical protein
MLQQEKGEHLSSEYAGDSNNRNHIQAERYSIDAMKPVVMERQWAEGQALIDPMLGGFQDGLDTEWQSIMDILSGAL